MNTITPKIKTTYFCQNCGVSSVKWIGRCPSCGQWNTYVEEVVTKNERVSLWDKTSDKKSKPQQSQLLSEVPTRDEQRIDMPDKELNRVLGGGLVPGSLVLMGVFS